MIDENKQRAATFRYIMLLRHRARKMPQILHMFMFPKHVIPILAALPLVKYKDHQSRLRTMQICSNQGKH